MRISTNQIYDAGTRNIDNNQAALYKLQNQLSTGRRVLTPEDDPVAAAQALLVTQASDMNTQQMSNQSTAKSQLGLVDSQLSTLNNLISNTRTLVIQAGNTSTLSTADRASIATELQSNLSQLIGIANTKNGSGDYIFSGYQGATLPFAVDATQAATAPATTSPIGYYGDNGQRLLQVSSSRQMATNVAGSDLFMNVKQGNGTFVTGTGGNISGGINQGTASVDTGSVLDMQSWQAGLNNFAWSNASNPALQVRFSVAAGVTTYQLYDVSTPASPVAISTAASYTPGQAIHLASTSPPAASATDFGAQIVVQGTPANGDTLSVKPSSNQSIFQTMQNLIGLLNTPIGSTTFTSTEYSNQLSQQLSNLDQAAANVSRVQSSVGSLEQELDSLSSAGSDLNVQYQSSLSSLQDLDWAQALSNFTMQQTYLQAAQKSFAQISGLSLFTYL